MINRWSFFLCLFFLSFFSLPRTRKEWGEQDRKTLQGQGRWYIDCVHRLVCTSSAFVIRETSFVSLFRFFSLRTFFLPSLVALLFPSFPPFLVASSWRRSSSLSLSPERNHLTLLLFDLPFRCRCLSFSFPFFCKCFPFCFTQETLCDIVKKKEQCILCVSKFFLNLVSFSYSCVGKCHDMFHWTWNEIEMATRISGEKKESDTWKMISHLDCLFPFKKECLTDLEPYLYDRSCETERETNGVT